jgi:hypothetical protein
MSNQRLLGRITFVHGPSDKLDGLEVGAVKLTGGASS